MRLIRASGETITPSDDGRLISKVLNDGLFGTVTFTVAGGQISLPAFKGVMCGRDFSVDAMTLSPELPVSETSQTGKVIARIDLTQPAGSQLSVVGVLNPYTLTTDDINESGGALFEMQLATYRATMSGVTSVSMSYTQTNVVSDTGWVTFNSAIVYRVRNGIVYMRVRQSGGTVRHHGYSFGTLPSEVAPRYSLAEANVYGLGRIFINQDHSVTFETSSESESSNYIQGTFVYPLG